MVSTFMVSKVLRGSLSSNVIDVENVSISVHKLVVEASVDMEVSLIIMDKEIKTSCKLHDFFGKIEIPEVILVYVISLHRVVERVI